MFYKTQAGAAVGDLFMSLISTCILNKIDPFQYLTETEKHAAQVAADPVEIPHWRVGGVAAGQRRIAGPAKPRGGV